MDSPTAFRVKSLILVHKAVGNHINDLVNWAVAEPLWNQIRDAGGTPVGAQVRAQASEAVRKHVLDMVEEPVWEQVQIGLPSLLRADLWTMAP